MGQDECAAAGLARGLSEEGVAGLPGGGFDGELALAGQGGDICALGEDGEFQTAGEPLDETGIGGAGGAAEAVVEVQDGDFAKALLDEGVEQNGGIDAAGDAGQDPAIAGDAGEREDGVPRIRIWRFFRHRNGP